MTIQEFLAAPPMEIVKYPAPILQQVAEPIQVTDELRVVSRLMLDLMYKWRGVGLAAPQVGLPYRIFVVNQFCDPNITNKEMVFINPEIFHYGTRHSLELEGCLSLPGIQAIIDRPRKVMVSTLDLEGKKHKYCYEGTMGRIISHELDHLDGILTIDRMTKDDRNRIQPLLDKLNR